MAKEILMPQMGMTMEKGTILEWFVKEGDIVEKGDVLLSVETDKAVLDVEAFDSGTVLKILAHQGETVPVLNCIGYLGSPGEILPETDGEVNDVSEKPPIQETVISATVSAAAVPVSGIRASPLAKKLGRENGIDLDSVAPNQDGIITKKEVLDKVAANHLPTTPTADRMMHKYGIDAAEVPHRDRRIMRRDVESYMSSEAREEADVFIEPSSFQKLAGEYLSRSWHEMPMVTNCIELDVTESLKLIDFLNAHYGKELHMKFGMTDVMIKVLAQAMAQNPNANVRYEDGRLRCIKGVHIGLAAATPKGLVVPVIRDADRKNIMEINREKIRLVEAARSGHLSPADLGGASTSFSNMGAYRAEMFTPIINYPESCIFGVGTIKKKAVVVDDEIVIRPMMWLNFTYDHRILDGEKAAKLLNAVKDVTELPALFIGYEGGCK